VSGFINARPIRASGLPQRYSPSVALRIDSNALLVAAVWLAPRMHERARMPWYRGHLQSDTISCDYRKFRPRTRHTAAELHNVNQEALDAPIALQSAYTSPLLANIPERYRSNASHRDRNFSDLQTRAALWTLL